MSKRPKKYTSNLKSIIGTLPMILTAIGVFVICVVYSIILSFTDSALFPSFDTFVGLENYERLWTTSRWLISVNNIWIFGLASIVFNSIFGLLLAIFMDRKVRMEDTFRTIMLYPYAMSFVVTGLVWQWMLDPNLGLQEAVRNLGFSDFTFAPLTNSSIAIFGVVLAGIWQGSGVTMAIMLAGLRGVDAEIWKASRVDGIPVWKTYLFIIIPMCKGTIATSLVLQSVGVVRVYDLIVALTAGGPGIATEVPAKFVIDHFTSRINVSLAMAGAAMLLVPILFILIIAGISRWRSNRLKERLAQ